MIFRVGKKRSLALFEGWYQYQLDLSEGIAQHSGKHLFGFFARVKRFNGHRLEGLWIEMCIKSHFPLPVFLTLV